MHRKLNHIMLPSSSGGIKLCPSSPVDFTPSTNLLFLAHYLICINIFMRFQVLLLLYSLLGRSLPLIGCWGVFNGTKFFFASMDTVSCWVDLLSQWESCAGFCLSDSAPGLRSSPPRLHPLLQARDGSVGGFKTTTRLSSDSLWCPGHACTPGYYSHW